MVDVLFRMVEHKDDPRAVLLVAHGFVELLVNALVEAHCKHAKKIAEDHRAFSHALKLVLLSEVGVISDAWYRRLDAIRKIRNRAAHEPLFEVTEADLCFFDWRTTPTLREYAKKRVVSRNQTEEDFARSLYFMVGHFWTRHRATFGPVFGQARLVPGMVFPSDGVLKDR